METLTTKFVHITIGTIAWFKHVGLHSMQPTNPLVNKRITGDQNFGINFGFTIFALIPYKK
jgi:hypothetical protein